VEKPSALLPSI